MVIEALSVKKQAARGIVKKKKKKVKKTAHVHFQDSDGEEQERAGDDKDVGSDEMMKTKKKRKTTAKSGDPAQLAGKKKTKGSNHSLDDINASVDTGPKKKKGQVEKVSRAWKVGHDSVKGRIMIATRDLRPGEIVLEEKPLVAASWHEHRCLECHEPHDSATCELVMDKYPAEVVKNLQKIEKFLTDLDNIAELDGARRVIKLLNMCRSDDNVETHTAPCTAENMDDCLAAIRAIRGHKAARRIIPDGMSDERAARLLSVLNTNSHELADWGGSGFYLLACLMEHSCAPNCAFNTDGTDLWVTATARIESGAALSIDYTDSVFEPASARIAHLQDSYGFACVCPACSSLPDLNRAFLCPACSATMWPRGQGLKPSAWRCEACARQLKQKERQRFLRIEAALDQEPPDSLEEVDEVLEHGVFDSTHYLILQPLRELGEVAAKDDEALADGTAEAIWRRVVAGAEKVLPQFHAQKAILYDCLAQVLVATGQREAAREAFRHSLHVTRVSAGEGTPPTVTAEALYEKPPGSSAELSLSYANVRERLASARRHGLEGLAVLASTPTPP